MNVIRPLKVLVLLAALAWLPAQALQLVVWDPQLQTKLGYGEVVGNKLNLQLVTDYSGPVVALFSQTDADRAAFAGLMPRYNGSLRGGVLTLNDGNGGAGQTLTRFLAPFKLTPSIQNPARSFSLPGLRTAPANVAPAAVPAAVPAAAPAVLPSINLK